MNPKSIEPTKKRFQSRKKVDNYKYIGKLLILPPLLLILLGLVSSSSVAYIAAFLFVIASLIFFPNYTTWRIGAEGEEKIAELLSHLDGSYFVIHDVVLPGMVKENIDHVVLGPNGIFVLETKNHKGYITCQGDWWTQRKIGRRGTPYFGNIGNPSKQVKRKAVLLNEFIHNHFKVNFYINGIVVFANEKAKLKIINPTVAVLRPQELCSFIQQYRSTSNGIEPEELDAAIKPYSCFS